MQSFERFPELTNIIQHLATHGGREMNNQWTNLLSEINKICDMVPESPSPLNASKLFDDNADVKYKIQVKWGFAERPAMSKETFERVVKEIQGVDVKPLIDKWEKALLRAKSGKEHTQAEETGRLMIIEVSERILTDLKQLSSNK